MSVDLLATPEFEIVRTYVLLQLWADAQVPRFGIETYEFHLLFRLRGSPGVTQAELGKLVARDAMSVSRLVRSLEERGLVKREPSPNDARAYLLSLTPKATALLARILGALEAAAPLGMWSRADVLKLVELVRRAGESYREACERLGVRAERTFVPRKGAVDEHPERSRVRRSQAEEPVSRAAKRRQR